MIAGVQLRDVVVRSDERGHLAELYSENFGDKIVHLYTCSVRKPCAKAFHAHVGVRDPETGLWGVGQTDRFTPIRGVTKVGCVDLRGPVYDSVTVDVGSGPALANFLRFGCSPTYLGIDGTPRPFHEVWHSNEEWIALVGESPTFLEQQTVILDAHAPQVLFIPPGVAHGIYCLSAEESEIINAPTVAFKREAPDELRLPAESFGFQWAPRSA